MEDNNTNPQAKKLEEMTNEELIEAFRVLNEELITAKEIIDEQNAAIEKMDAEKGTETGRFFEHKKKKIQLRIPTFRLQGKKYGIKDLEGNVEITVKGDKNKNQTIGITDYLIKIESPILEIEE